MDARINLIIAESDSVFLKELANYASKNYSGLTPISCNNNTVLADVLDKDNADVLLLDEELYSQTIEDLTQGMGTKIMFTAKKQNPALGICPKSGWKMVFKFQKMSVLFNEVQQIHAQSMDTTQNTEKIYIPQPGYVDTKIMAFYSPIGGSGKTTLALACALTLIHNMGQRVFYLNLENINGNAVYTPTKGGENMSGLFDALKQPYSTNHKIKMMRVTDAETQLEYFRPPDSGLQFNELTKTQIHKLLSDIAALKEYDTVIIDLSAHFSDTNMFFLEKSDSIIMPVVSGLLPLQKINAFYSELPRRYELSALKDKIILVWNMCKNDAPPDLSIHCNIPLLPGIKDAQSLNSIRLILEKYLNELLDFMAHKA